jgi:hypothetical protein
MRAEVIPIDRDGVPPEYREKMILEVTEKGRGYEVELACGHLIWTPVEVLPGNRMYCGQCIGGVLKK